MSYPKKNFNECVTYSLELKYESFTEVATKWIIIEILIEWLGHSVNVGGSNKIYCITMKFCDIIGKKYILPEKYSVNCFLFFCD